MLYAIESDPGRIKERVYHKVAPYMARPTAIKVLAGLIAKRRVIEVDSPMNNAKRLFVPKPSLPEHYAMDIRNFEKTLSQTSNKIFLMTEALLSELREDSLDLDSPITKKKIRAFIKAFNQRFRDPSRKRKVNRIKRLLSLFAECMKMAVKFTELLTEYLLFYSTRPLYRRKGAKINYDLVGMASKRLYSILEKVRKKIRIFVKLDFGTYSLAAGIYEFKLHELMINSREGKQLRIEKRELFRREGLRREFDTIIKILRKYTVST